MKKIIQVCSLLSLAFVFIVTSASAQSSFGTDVEVPFAFTVGDHSYDAGNYIVKLEKRPTGMATLSIQDTKTDEVQTVMVNVNGDSPSVEIKLVFDTIEGRRYLTKIRTPDQTFALIKSKAEKNAAAKARAVEKSVS